MEPVSDVFDQSGFPLFFCPVFPKWGSLVKHAAVTVI